MVPVQRVSDFLAGRSLPEVKETKECFCCTSLIYDYTRNRRKINQFKNVLFVAKLLKSQGKGWGSLSSTEISRGCFNLLFCPSV